MANAKRTPKSEGTPVGWRLPEAIREEFTRWCETHKHKLEGDFASAVYLWMRLPSRMRDWANLSTAGDPEYGPSFWQTVRDSFDEASLELEKQLRAGRDEKGGGSSR